MRRGQARQLLPLRPAGCSKRDGRLARLARLAREELGAHRSTGAAARRACVQSSSVPTVPVNESNLRLGNRKRKGARGRDIDDLDDDPWPAPSRVLIETCDILEICCGKSAPLPRVGNGARFLPDGSVRFLLYFCETCPLRCDTFFTKYDIFSPILFWFSALLGGIYFSGWLTFSLCYVLQMS